MNDNPLCSKYITHNYSLILFSVKLLRTILIEHHLHPYILSFNNIVWHPYYGSMQE